MRRKGYVRCVLDRGGIIHDELAIAGSFHDRRGPDCRSWVLVLVQPLPNPITHCWKGIVRVVQQSPVFKVRACCYLYVAFAESNNGRVIRL